MATILDPFPRVTLASLPTPLEPLPRLSAFLGGMGRRKAPGHRSASTSLFGSSTFDEQM